MGGQLIESGDNSGWGAAAVTMSVELVRVVSTGGPYAQRSRWCQLAVPLQAHHGDPYLTEPEFQHSKTDPGRSHGHQLAAKSSGSDGLEMPSPSV